MEEKHINHKSGSIRILFTIGYSLLCVIFVFAGCGERVNDNSAAIEPPHSNESVSDQEPEIIQDEGRDGACGIVEPEVEMVFDFVEFSGDGFPQGLWTIDQLADRYGPPEELTAFYVPVYNAVYIDFVHKDIWVVLRSVEAEIFSFSDDVLAQAGKKSKGGITFSLNEPDKNLDLDVISIEFYSNIAEFPRNIIIGESSKQEVLDSYPSGTATSIVIDGEFACNELIFHYNFRTENGELPDWYSCSVTYGFDENDILSRVYIGWVPGY